MNDLHPIYYLIILILIVMLTGIALAPKNVDYYYLSETSQAHTAACVYAHWTWHSDEIAFCTDDAGKALGFMTQANQALKAAGR